MTETKKTDGPLPHVLFEPERHPGEELPLIVFLHGHGEGSEGEPSKESLDRVKACALPKLAADGLLPEIWERGFPAVIAAPQVSTAEGWGAAVGDGRLLDLLDRVVDEHGIDRGRIYLTGLSSGGTAVWELAEEDPDRFAALAPMSPEHGRIPPEADRVREIPTWVFAGEGETGFKTIKATVDELIAKHADVKLTPDPTLGHEQALWNEFYGRADLYEWMLEQRTPR